MTKYRRKSKAKRTKMPFIKGLRSWAGVYLIRSFPKSPLMMNIGLKIGGSYFRNQWYNSKSTKTKWGKDPTKNSTIMQYTGNITIRPPKKKLDSKQKRKYIIEELGHELGHKRDFVLFGPPFPKIRKLTSAKDYILLELSTEIQQKNALKDIKNRDYQEDLIRQLYISISDEYNLSSEQQVRLRMFTSRKIKLMADMARKGKKVIDIRKKLLG